MSVKDLSTLKLLSVSTFLEASQWTQTLTPLSLSAKFIDEYIRLRVKQAEAKDQTTNIDPRLEKIVENMFDRCFNEVNFCFS